MPWGYQCKIGAEKSVSVSKISDGIVIILENRALTDEIFATELNPRAKSWVEGVKLFTKIKLSKEGALALQVALDSYLEQEEV